MSKNMNIWAKTFWLSLLFRGHGVYIWMSHWPSYIICTLSTVQGTDLQAIIDDIRKLKIIVKGHERRIKSLEEQLAQYDTQQQADYPWMLSLCVSGLNDACSHRRSKYFHSCCTTDLAQFSRFSEAWKLKNFLPRGLNPLLRKSEYFR